MKALTSFGEMREIENLNVSIICDLHSSFPCMQDAIHLSNKLKNRLYDTANDLEMGKSFATINHLKILVENVSKDKHFLTHTDVSGSDQSRDKMNFDSTRKIAKDAVIDLLQEHVKGSEGTVSYLKLIRSVIRAYIDVDTPPLIRLFNAYYGVSFVRRWRNDIQGAAFDNFVTSNIWTCMELNFSFLLDLVLKGNSHLILIWNSQTCEELFRSLRSLTSFGLTEINFTLLEALEKINRVKKIHDIAFELRDTFELSENVKKKSDILLQNSIVENKPSIEACREILNEASQEAEEECKLLKMTNFSEVNPQKYLKKVRLTKPQEQSMNNTECEEQNDVTKIKDIWFVEEYSGKN
jgi:hypothetical protein